MQSIWFNDPKGGEKEWLPKRSQCTIHINFQLGFMLDVEVYIFAPLRYFYLSNIVLSCILLKVPLSFVLLLYSQLSYDGVSIFNEAVEAGWRVEFEVGSLTSSTDQHHVPGVFEIRFSIDKAGVVHHNPFP